MDDSTDVDVFLGTTALSSDMSRLVCNIASCRAPLRAVAWVTSCSHMICDACGEDNFAQKLNGEQCRECPVCYQSLIGDVANVAKIRLNPSELYKTQILAGLSPEVVLDIAARAISFYYFQMEMQIQMNENTVKQKLTQLLHGRSTDASMIRKLQEDTDRLQKELGHVCVLQE